VRVIEVTDVVVVVVDVDSVVDVVVVVVVVADVVVVVVMLYVDVDVVEVDVVPVVVEEVEVVDPMQMLLAAGDSYPSSPNVLKTTKGLSWTMYMQPKGPKLKPAT